MVTAISLTITLVLASSFPPPVFLPMLGTLLSMSSTATAFVALVLAQPVFSPSFTYWDKAALLLLLSLAAFLGGDQDAARVYLESQAGIDASNATQIADRGEN